MKNAAFRILIPAMAAGLAVMVSACGAAVSHHAAAATAATAPARSAASQPSQPVPDVRASHPATIVATTVAYSGPHFSTPQAAMRYLARAYNHDRALMHAVTTPQAYRQLMGMRSEAVNLRLLGCVPSGSGRGDYICTFRHDYLASLHKSGHGSARFLVAPADNPGWYMDTLLDCG